MIYFDRSRREAAEKCLRRRWWGYEYRGRGIEPRRTGQQEWPLITGSAVHREIECLMCAQFGGIPALSLWEFEGMNDRACYLAQEQQALAEAIARCWATVRRAEFLATCEVLDVEREELADLGGVTLMARPDILVRRKSDGSLFIINLKTTKRADQRWREQWKYDQQTLGEVLAVEARVGKKLSGVIIEGLLKGEQREYPKGSGQWYHDSPLIWAWHKQHDKPHPRGEWTPRWEWQDETGNHTLGKGWRKEEVWLHYPGGVQAWIAWLAENDPAVLHEQIVTLPPVMRSEFEIERWKRQIVVAEKSVRASR